MTQDARPLTPREVARLIESAAAAIRAELAALPDDVLAWHPAPGEWCAKEVLGHLRVGDLLHEWVHHDRNHLRQLLANIQAAAWPHMGNARRFSAP